VVDAEPCQAQHDGEVEQHGPELWGLRLTPVLLGVPCGRPAGGVLPGHVGFDLSSSAERKDCDPVTHQHDRDTDDQRQRKGQPAL
jgi:hypothetical protein